VSELFETLQADMNTARKAQDKALTLVLGTILADVKNRRIELRREPTNEEIVEVLRKGIKKRKESIDMYTKAGRTDLQAKEQAEVDVLERYLPPAVDPEEIRAAIRAAITGGATNMGALMGKVNPMFKGRAEGSLISALAKEELAK
jgi:uncharacterized protein YqeY